VIGREGGEGERGHGSGTRRTRPNRRECGGRGAVSSGGAGYRRKWEASDGKMEENGAVRVRVWRIRCGIMAEGNGAAIVHRRAERTGGVGRAWCGAVIRIRTSRAGAVKDGGPSCEYHHWPEESKNGESGGGAAGSNGGSHRGRGVSQVVRRSPGEKVVMSAGQVIECEARYWR